MTAAHTGIDADKRSVPRTRPGAHAASGRLRQARHLRRPVRHAHRVPDRCGQPRSRATSMSPAARSTAWRTLSGQRWQNTLMGIALRRSYRRRSRIGGIPIAIASEPAALMAKEITTPGHRQIRAMFVSRRAIPVLSVPNGDELESAFESLDLSVALDFYVTETTSRCDYILPVTTMYERDDFPFTFQAFQATPFRQATEAVVAPAGQARTGWDIVGRPDRAIGSRRACLRVHSVRSERRLKPSESASRHGCMIDALIRMSQGGDRFGLRRGGLVAPPADRRASARRGRRTAHPHRCAARRGGLSVASDPVGTSPTSRPRSTSSPGVGIPMAIRCG